MSDAKIGFELRKIQVPIEHLLPVRHIKDPMNSVRRYQAIFVSVKEVGLIEPLMVYPQTDAPGKYLLLDGHLRLFALKELGHTVAECIIARDDECFTYNARVSRVTPIQEHRMIVKAVEMGVDPERIAAALNIPVRIVTAYMNLLVGIHAEVADLLKDKNVTPGTLRSLRRVNAVRQVEIAELMVGTNSYSHAYVEALILEPPATVKEAQAILSTIPAATAKALKVVKVGFDPNIVWFQLVREDGIRISVKKQQNAFRVRVRDQAGALLQEVNAPYNGLNAVLMALA
jgi:hypothetical protein